tara:strand:- start:160 stop:486 length:327 start_codon:yes stop_codon:yes gene_type:complete
MTSRIRGNRPVKEFPLTRLGCYCATAGILGFAAVGIGLAVVVLDSRETVSDTRDTAYSFEGELDLEPRLIPMEYDPSVWKSVDEPPLGYIEGNLRLCINQNPLYGCVE